MRYDFAQPAPDLRRYIGSYYIMEMPDAVADIARAEIPHIRILVAGTSVLRHGDELTTIDAPAVIVSGPTMSAGHASVSAGSIILGASLLPLGWAAILGVGMDEFADRKGALDDFFPVDADRVRCRILEARDDTELFGVADELFRSAIRPVRAYNEGFVEETLQWLTDPRSPGVGEIASRLDLSARQLDRLCNRFFGAPPKRLHRKHRAIHISTRLAWTGETDWRHVAGDQFYDQAHFIKDFKDLIGCTPGEYIRGRNMMVRFDLMQRLAIPHTSRFSLVG